MNVSNSIVIMFLCFLLAAACPGALTDVALADVDVNVSLQDAVKQGLVDVKVSAIGGSTGNTIRVNVQRKVAETVQVKITPGTVFVAVGGKVQNMTGGKVIGEFTRKNLYRPGSVMVLADNNEHSFLVESYCLDYRKPAPKRGHSFSLALHDGRANRILKAPKGASVSIWAYQSALWMDRAGVSGDSLRRHFPKHITKVEIRAAEDMLRHAEKTGVAEIPQGIDADVRVQIEKLYSSHPAVRVAATRRLGSMGSRAKVALPFIAVNVIDPRTGTTRINVPEIPEDAAKWLKELGIPQLDSVLGQLNLDLGAGGIDIPGILGGNDPPRRQATERPQP